MICPNCQRDALTLKRFFDLEADAYSDEIRFQLLRCSLYRLTAAGVCEESRRASSDFAIRGKIGERLSRLWALSEFQPI
jgi:hypothetical protein